MNDRRNDGHRTKPQRLLLGLVVVAILAGIAVTSPGKRNRALERIQQLGGTVEFNPPGQPSRWRMALSAPRVEAIKLRGTPANGEDLLKVLVFGPLTELDLSGTSIQPGDLSALSRVRSVHRLTVASTHIGDEDLSQIAELSNLKSLNLRGTSISDRGLAQLDRLTLLEKLDVSSTAVTCAGLRQLSQLTQLKCIWVDEACVTAESVGEFQRMKSLDSIAVHIPHGTGKGTRELLSKLPGISVSGYTDDDGPFLWYSSIAWDECTAGVFEVVSREVQLDADESQKFRDLLAAAMPNGKWPLPGMTPGEILNSSIVNQSPPDIPQIASLDEFLKALRERDYQRLSLGKFWYEKVRASDAATIIAAAPDTEISKDNHLLFEYRARALVRFGLNDEVRLRELERLISSKNDWIRGSTIEAFGELATALKPPPEQEAISEQCVDRAFLLLLPLCSDKSLSMRRQTSLMLSRLISSQPQLADKAMKCFVILALNEEVHALSYPAQLCPDAATAAIPLVRESLTSTDPKLRASAVQTLGILACADGPAAEVAVNVCLDELKNSNSTVATAAASALGKIATHDHPVAVKRAILGAMACADPKVPTQRAAAERALADIAVAIRDRLLRRAESTPK